jgi:YggT family protein
LFTNALIFLVNTVFGLFVVTLLLRFYLQWVRASHRNPLSLFLQALTDFMVRPARRAIPGLWGLDLATLILAWLVQLLELAIVLQIQGSGFGPTVGAALLMVALLALVLLIKIFLYIIMVAVFAQVICSWFSLSGPMIPVLNSMTRPFLRPFQRRIPPIGNVDLSPLFLLVAIQLLLMLPVAWLETSVTHLF